MSMKEDGAETFPQGLVYVFVAVVAAISLVGFLRGVEHTQPADHGAAVVPHATSTPTGDIRPARSYEEMRLTPPSNGGAWGESVELATKASPRDGTGDAKAVKDALRKRQRARAYDGAPPTIPHSVRQSSASECMACHGQGLRLGERRAAAVPHDEFTSCSQCHVPQAGPVPSPAGLAKDPRAVANGFRGTQAPVRGERAWSIAPPQTPHSTFMRENCMACHGENGPSAMRSSHTKRTNCTQCHAGSAEMNQQPGLESWLAEQER